LPTQAELEALLAFPNETLSNEYKTWLNLDSSHGKATLAKAAIALANHGGGIIVMGMLSVAGTPMRSVDRDHQIARYTTDSVNAAVNRYADPKIACEVTFALHQQTGFEHAIISIPGSSVPVMSTRLEERVIAQNRCYIRKPGPQSEEPTTAEEWRGLLNRCIQAGRETMLESIRAILHGQVLSPAATAEQIDRLKVFMETARNRWENRIAVLPTDDLSRLPYGRYELGFELLGIPKIGLVELKDRMDNAGRVSLTGWGPFVDIGRRPIGPAAIDGGIEAWLGDPADGRRDGRHSDFWRAEPSGFFYSMRSLDEDFHSGSEPRAAFDVTLPIWRVGETMLYIARLATSFGAETEVAFRGRYSGLAGRTTQSPSEYRVYIHRRATASDVVEFEGRATAKQIDDNLDEVLHQLLSPLYEVFEFFKLPMELVSSQLMKLRKRG